MPASPAASAAASERDPVASVLKWLLLILAVLLFAFLAWGTLITYREAPPLPSRFESAKTGTLFSGSDVIAGKAAFQRADLMDYGSLYGMGSYFGPDYTAQYLVEMGRRTEAILAQERFGKPLQALRIGEHAEVQAEMQRDLQSVRLDSAVVTLAPELAEAIRGLQADIVKMLLTTNLESGYTRAYSLTEQDALRVADFLIYSSLTTIARRPGQNYSYTNNWPYEPEVGNTPTLATFNWTWASFMITFFAFGLVLYIFHRWITEPDSTPKQPLFTEFRPLMPSQTAVGKYFLVVALVFLVQIGAGGLMAHDYAERADFYGIVINHILPFNALRSIHLQAPIVWIGLSWIGSALFLAPLIAGEEAKGQALLVEILFWVTLAIVAGALLGDYFGIMGLIGRAWFWFGNQGLSYIQLGRAWQIGFALGLLLWSYMVFRALWPTMAKLRFATWEFWTGRITLEHLFWASTINIAVLYWFGMIPMTSVAPSFTITDYWRWWVVHLWVEQSFEFFAVVVTAYLLVAIGLIGRGLAFRTVLFETILIFLGGIIGTGHHWYWVGEPALWVPAGSVFSFIEVLPLLLLVIEAEEQRRLIREAKTFRYGLAYTYIIGAALWNFLGAGVFGGGTLNAPLVNYYEHATTLTLNHAHTALFGAFGLLAIGMVYFCLRYAAGDEEVDERFGKVAFWLYNIGLLMWVFFTFFPVGWRQLGAVYEHGLAYARSLSFYDTQVFWQWFRMFGDIVFALGALLMAWDFYRQMRPWLPAWLGGRAAAPKGVPAE
ncbi:MAG: cbb3-type cytochrome c oxidase subunit I [Acetobacteraceae bacterium]|nr:cbb3-type cytochrome c oxidase subunit I [Acetobacteraceae bacterium]